MGALSPTLDLEAALARVASSEPARLRSSVRDLLNRSTRLFGASGGVIEQCDGEDLVYAIASEALVEREGFRLRRAGSLSGLASRTGEVQYCPDVALDRRVDRAACQALGLRSMVCAPFLVAGRAFVLKFISSSPDAFSSERREQVQALGERLQRALGERGDERACDLRSPAGAVAAPPSIVSSSQSAIVSSRQLLEAVERIGGLGSWTLDPETLDMRWSEGFHHMLGADSRHDVARLDDLLHWTPAEDRAALLAFLAGPASRKPISVRVQPPGAEARWIRFLRDAGAPIDGVHIGAAHDVSVLYAARKAQASYQAAFETLSKLFGAMVWRTDVEGSLSFELGWCAYTGTTLVQNRGDRWLDQLHPEDRAAAGRAWRQALAAGTPFAARFRVRRHDGFYELFDSRALARAGDEGLEWLGVTTPLARDHPGTEIDRDSAPMLCPSPRELKAMRALVGWTVDDLAASSGVSASTITRYEREPSGQTPTRPSNLDRLVEALLSRGVKVVQRGDHRAIVQMDADAGDWAPGSVSRDDVPVMTAKSRS